MRRLAGRTVLKGTGLGIKDLLVVVRTGNDERRDTGGDDVRASDDSSLGERLGSVLTGDDGSFELTVEDSDLGGRARGPRLDLLLTVLAPEGPDQDAKTRVLFVSPRRADAAPIEHWIIQLPADRLTAAGIPLPTSPAEEIVEDGERVAERLLTADRRRESIDEGMRAIDRKRAQRSRTSADAFRLRLRPSMRRALSRVPDDLPDPDSFVRPGESVLTKSNAIIRRGIKQVVNSTDPRVRAPVRGVIALTRKQRSAVAAALGPNGTISADDLDDILSDGGGPRRPATFMVRADPIGEICRERSGTETECLGDLLGGGSSGGDDGPDVHDGPGGPDDSGEPDDSGAVTADTINRLIARVTTTMTAPEEGVLFGLEPRADRGTVGADVSSLAFEPSPADVPAFYDFHHLQIAFEHVWQEAIDEGVLDLAEDAYEDIVELGGDPDNGDNSGGIIIDPVRTLLDEGRFVLSARREPRDHRGRSVVRDHREGVVVRDHRGEVVVRDPRADVLDPRTDVRDHQGERPDQRLPELLRELERRLREEYAFTVYAANRKERSVNFGVLLTYRQRWEPLAYQAGKLIKTITLAPKETQRYSRKTTIRRKRAEKEVEFHSRVRREEASQTSRAEQEIVRKARTKTNFSLVTEGSYDLEFAEGTATTTFAREAEKSSDDVKKAFHESIFKSSQEYKDEHTTEINTEESEEFEVTESGEITNPNDELAVTFLFYELQRRYRISERIHRAIPVVLVAQEVPRPDEIDEAWIISNDWILRRALLDDSYVSALDYLATGVVGEEVALDELRRNVDQQRRIVDELRRELAAVRERESFQRGLLERALFQQIGIVPDRKGSNGGGGGGGIFGGIPVVGEALDDGVEIASDIGGAVGGAILGGASKLGDFLFGGSAEDGQSRQDTIAQILDRTADEARDLLFRLEREITALNAITEKYTQALGVHFNHKAEIARFRTHLKNNILYYMQALWTYEPPDQRFFRLHQVPIPTLEVTRRTYHFPHLQPVRGALAETAHRGLDLFGRPGRRLYPFEVTAEVDPQFVTKPLVQVADLDSLLGFKGNYMVFPLRESNALTDYMLDPYVAAGFDELIDPDDLGNMTIDEFAQYVCCLREHLTNEQFDAIRGQLADQYRTLLTSTRPTTDILTVPTNSLFIEALPASHSLIERYKAIHRAVDVKMEQEKLRERALESLRLAARLLAGEHEDPTIDRKIVVEGPPGTPGIVVPADDAGGGSAPGGNP